MEFTAFLRVIQTLLEAERHSHALNAIKLVIADLEKGISITESTAALQASRVANRSAS